MASTTAKAAPESVPQGLEIPWDSLTPELCAEAEGWRPEVGDSIRGRVLAVKVGTSELIERAPGRAPEVKVTRYPIVIVLREGARTTDKAVSVHCFHAVSKNEVLSARPAFGDEIYCKFLGERSEGKNGRAPAKLYAMSFPNNTDNSNVYDQF